MGNQVFANMMEVSCKAASGKSICAFPDVCFTPPQTPATPPGVPIPYPNTGMASDTSDGSTTVKISGQEVMLKNKSYFKKSMGDEAGCAPKKNVITSKNMGKVYFTMWSMDVKVEGENVVRHLDLTTHNHASGPPGTPPMAHADEMAVSTPTDEPCDHDWQETKRETPEETKQKNSDNAAVLRSKPSKASQAKGPEFENEAIDKNMEKLQVQATSVEFKCSKCGIQQEVDIVGKDQIAEAKNRTAKGVKGASQQHKNYRDIQAKRFNKEQKPVGKFPKDHPEATDVESIFSRRGFQAEGL
jgi:hypothetical protein